MKLTWAETNLFEINFNKNSTTYKYWPALYLQTSQACTFRKIETSTREKLSKKKYGREIDVISEMITKSALSCSLFRASPQRE